MMDRWGQVSPEDDLAEDIRGVEPLPGGGIDQEVPDGHDDRAEQAGDDTLANCGMALRVHHGSWTEAASSTVPEPSEPQCREAVFAITRRTHTPARSGRCRRGRRSGPAHRDSC